MTKLKPQKELEYIARLETSQLEESQDFQVMKQEHALIKDIIKKFISQQNLLVYGGYALNALLPQKDRFYSEEEMYDFDIFSPSAKEHARLLADMLYEKGFIYTEVKPAIHEGTFKLYVNFQAVADITNVSETFFYEMLKLSRKEKSKHKYLKENLPPINIAPIYFLKYFIITELSRPKSSLFRWEKTYTRLSLLYKYYGANHRRLTRSTKISNFESHHEIWNPEIKNILNKVLEIIKVHKFPLIGNYAMGIYLGENTNLSKTFVAKCCRLDPYFSVFDILATDIEKALATIKVHLESFLPQEYVLETEVKEFEGDIILKHIKLYLNIPSQNITISLLTIVNASNHCFSVIEKADMTLGTPYTILSFLYANWLMHYVHENRKIVTLIHQLVQRWESYIYEESPMEERFVASCYGYEKSILNVKKEHFQDASKKYIYRPADRTNIFLRPKNLFSYKKKSQKKTQ